MKIRNIIYACAVAAMLTATTSCDDFLDIRPKGRVIVTTAKDFREMLTQAYSIIPSDRGLASFRSDEFEFRSNLSSEDISSYKDIWLWQDDAADDATASFNWRNYYQVIYEANHVIENQNKITEGTTAEIRQMVGEGYMLRAYMHFLLVNLYGEPYTAGDPYQAKGVPLKMDNDVEKVLTRSSVGDVYDQILCDIDSAEQYLNVEEWDEGYNYRFNTLCPDAMRSRVYLYMGRWQQSLEASERVLARKNTLSDPSSELPNAYNSAENILAMEQVFSATTAKAAWVNKDFYNTFDISDKRIAKYFYFVTRSNIRCNKAGSNEHNCTFRVGEMMLNAAEAAMQAGDSDKARQHLYTLMATRYPTTYWQNTMKPGYDTLDNASLLTLIYEERARELAFEGHRWFDLRRTTRPAMTRTWNGETYTLSKDDSRYTLRIPSDAIAANPSLAE